MTTSTTITEPTTDPADLAAITGDDQLLDTLGGKLGSTNPATDQLSQILIAWRQQIDSTAHRPAVADYLTELARIEHIELEGLRRQQSETRDIHLIEELARRAHDVAVVERFLNDKIATLLGGAR